MTRTAFFSWCDRKKDVIISGGENLYPVQIEDFLAAYLKVHDVAVIGPPDHWARLPLQSSRSRPE